MFYFTGTNKISIHNYLFIHGLDESKTDWYKKKNYLDKDLNNSRFIEYTEVTIEYPKRSFKRFTFNQNSN